MKRFFVLCLVVCSIAVLSACQTSELSTIPTVVPTDKVTVKAPVRAIPVNPLDYIGEQTLRTQLTPVGNLLGNPGFEFGSLDSWTACEAGGIELSNDAYEGSGALKVNQGNCFYQSVGINPDTELTLSCYAKLLSGNGWTGMGLGFADSNWNTIGDGQSTVITGNSYQRYDVVATAPTNTKYVSMWFYSDNPAVVDNCSLYPEGEPPPPPPPPPSGDNLLENPNFMGLFDWSTGCSGVVGTETSGGAVLSNGACMDQSLSASDISELQAKDYTYSCSVKNTGGYASMSIFLDGQPTSVVIPNNNAFQTIEVQGTAGNNVNSGFVSLYAEGTALTVSSCSLSVEGDEPPPSGDNLLDNGDFEILDATLRPVNWTKGCGGSWASATVNGRGLTLGGGVCIDQGLSTEDLAALSGNSYTYSCYAKNVSGYASISIFLDGEQQSKTIPVGNTLELVEISGQAGQLSSAFVSIYSEGSLFIDDCSLTVDGGGPPTGTPSIDVRNGAEGSLRFSTFSPQGPFTFEVAIRNNGDVPLAVVNYSSDNLVCSGTILDLAVGEIQLRSCESTTALENYGDILSHTVTVTGETVDGRVVTDSDIESYRYDRPAPNPGAYMDISTDTRIIEAGDDVEFFVTIAGVGPIAYVAPEVTSNVADCERNVSVGGGSLLVYSCTATNVQEGFIATVEAYNNRGGTRQHIIRDRIDIVIQGTVAIDMNINGEDTSEGNEIKDVGTEPYSFTIFARNTGAVDLQNVQFSSDTVPACNRTISNLAVGEIEEYTCVAPTLAPAQRINQTITVVGSTANGQQISDSDSTEIYRQSDIKLDVSLGAEGADVVTVNPGENLDIVIRLANTGFVDFNNIQALYIWRSSPYDGTICQNSIPYSGIGDPDVAFDLAVGETKTFTCTLQNITADVELNLVAYLSNTTLPGSVASGGEVFSYDPDKLIIKVN